MAKSQEIVQIEEIDKGLTNLNKTIGVTAENYLKLVKTIAGNTQAIKDNVTSYTGLGEAQKKTEEEGKKLDALAKKFEASERRLKELTDERTRSIIANNLEVQKQTAEAKRQVIINKSLEGSYEQLNAELNSNINTYKGLSQAERENAAIGGELIKTIMQQDAAIKKIDESMGRHQRNVGNYKSGFNGLNFSIMQIGRELPSLAYGVNVFASAISNNIPMMTDELKKAREEILRAKAAGEKSVPIWKQVAGAIFSWQTAMVVGLTLFTLYGKEIFTWIGNLFKSKDAINQTKVAQERLNEARKKGYENGQSELVHTRLLYDATQNHAMAIDEKRKAIKELQNSYPEYLGKFSEEEILAGKAGRAYYELANAIMSSAKAKAYEQVIVENEVKKFELENKVLEERKKLTEAQTKLSKAEIADQNAIGDGAIYTGNALRMANDEVEKYNKSINDLNTQISQLEYSSKELADKIKPTDLLSNLGAGQYKDSQKEDEKAQKQAQKTKEEAAKENERIQRDMFIAMLNIQKDENKQTLEDEKQFHKEFTEELKQRSKQNVDDAMSDIDNIQLAREEQAIAELSMNASNTEQIRKIWQNLDHDLINIEKDRLTELLKNGELTVSDREKIEKQLRKLSLETAKEDIQNASDAAEEKKRLNKEIERAATDTLSQSIETTIGLKNYEFEEQLSRLETERKAKLDNENLTSKQKAAIEEEYDRKANAIKRKKAQNDKLAALFQIAINTAVAISEASPVVPLMIMAGITGALQTALVSAQPIPQYAKGTQNAASKFIAGEAGEELMRLRSGETFLVKDTTYFEGNKFKGAQIYSNPETEKILSASEHSGFAGRQMADERILKGLSAVEQAIKSNERAIKNKPVQIVDRDYRPIGQGNSNYQTIYLNKLTRRS